MPKFRNMSGGLLRVYKREGDNYVSVLIEAGADVLLTKDEVKKIKEELKYSNWFENGYLVKLEETTAEEVTQSFLESLAKQPMPKFTKEVTKIKSLEALEELLKLVKTKKGKRILVEEQIEKFPQVTEGGGNV